MTNKAIGTSNTQASNMVSHCEVFPSTTRELDSASTFPEIKSSNDGPLASFSARFFEAAVARPRKQGTLATDSFRNGRSATIVDNDMTRQ